VKDIIATVDAPTEMGSPIYAGYRPDKDAECVARLKRAGGYVFGKAVTTAFAFLDPSKTKNPWNPRHTPGGSSSGPAAAVASGHVPGAIGTQTNGSVIRPAAYCGVVGFKPTKDAIPYAGVHLFSKTLDQLGTFTRSVADAARLAGALAGTSHVGPLGAPPARAPRFAYLDGFPWTREVDCDADDTLDAAATTLRKHGALVVAVGFPAPWREVNRVHKTIMLYEAGTYLGALQDRGAGAAHAQPQCRPRRGPEDDACRLRRGAEAAGSRHRVLHGVARRIRRDHRAAGAWAGARGSRHDRRPLVLHAVVADGFPGIDAAHRIRR
jgi:amidase